MTSLDPHGRSGAEWGHPWRPLRLKQPLHRWDRGTASTGDQVCRPWSSAVAMPDLDYPKHSVGAALAYARRLPLASGSQGRSPMTELRSDMGNQVPDWTASSSEAADGSLDLLLDGRWSRTESRCDFAGRASALCCCSESLGVLLSLPWFFSSFFAPEDHQPGRLITAQEGGWSNFF